MSERIQESIHPPRFGFELLRRGDDHFDRNELLSAKQCYIQAAIMIKRLPHRAPQDLKHCLLRQAQAHLCLLEILPAISCFFQSLNLDEQ